MYPKPYSIYLRGTKDVGYVQGSNFEDSRVPGLIQG